MKTFFVLLGGSTVAFIVGLAVTYLALPFVAPDLTKQSRTKANVSVADTAVTLPEDSLSLPQDSLALLFEKQKALVKTLRDSLAIVMNRLHSSQAMEMSLAGQIEQLRQRERAAAARRVEAAQLGSSLARLDVRERRDLIEQLDRDVLQKIYIEASPRSRTLLLEAMEPKGAAGLVGLLVQPDQAPAKR